MSVAEDEDEDDNNDGHNNGNNDKAQPPRLSNKAAALSKDNHRRAREQQEELEICSLADDEQSARRRGQSDGASNALHSGRRRSICSLSSGSLKSVEQMHSARTAAAIGGVGRGARNALSETLPSGVAAAAAAEVAAPQRRQQQQQQHVKRHCQRRKAMHSSGQKVLAAASKCAAKAMATVPAATAQQAVKSAKSLQRIHHSQTTLKSSSQLSFTSKTLPLQQLPKSQQQQQQRKRSPLLQQHQPKHLSSSNKLLTLNNKSISSTNKQLANKLANSIHQRCHNLNHHQTSTLSSSTFKANYFTTTNHTMADQAVIDKLEAGFAKLQASTPEQCHSLLKKYLTREVLDQLKSKKTAMNASLLDVVQSGFENLDSGVGIYAPDAESYTLFDGLFNPIIEDYHGGFKATDKHPQSDFGDLETLVNVDPDNQFVISTRVRCGRSLKGYPFNPCLTEDQYKEMESKVSSTLKELDGDLAGKYYPLTGMTKETQQQLIDDHFLFKEGDRFLQAANACRYWPTGRGIYHNDSKTFLVWVNEEDHLRIISMQKGGDLKQVFGRLVKGARAIEAKVPFSRDDRLGFLTFCPTNLGTTIRASVHIKLPKLAADRKKLEEVAGRYNLQVRGTSGEHTESVGGVYDISNKRRLGLTEYQAVREMQDGILELIKIEKSL